MRKILPIILCLLFFTGCTKPKQEEKETIEKQETTIKEEIIDKQDPDVEEKMEEPKDTYERYDLDVPQYVQETAYYCSVAALQSVMAYHGIQASQSELAQDLHTDPVTGTEYEDLARVATKRIFPNGEGVYTCVIPTSDADKELFEQRLIEDMRSADPVFVSINNRMMYEDVPDQVHQVVVVGVVVEKNHVTRINFFDPSYTRQDSVYRGLKACSFDELWDAMLQNPEPGYVY